MLPSYCQRDHRKELYAKGRTVDDSDLFDDLLDFVSSQAELANFDADFAVRRSLITCGASKLVQKLSAADNMKSAWKDRGKTSKSYTAVPVNANNNNNNSSSSNSPKKYRNISR